MKHEPSAQRSSTSERDHQDQSHVRGWSEGDIPRKQAFPEEIEPPWGVEHVPQSPNEQWGGRAGSRGNDTPRKAPKSPANTAASEASVVQMPPAPKTKRSPRGA